MSVNLRIELMLHNHASRSEREKASANLVKKFKKEVDKLGLVTEMRQRRFYEKPSEKKRRKRIQQENARRYAELADKDTKKKHNNLTD